MISDLIMGLIGFFTTFCIICYFMYIERIKSIIIVDFDTFIIDMAHLEKKADIYVKNCPNGKRGEYISKRIHEQVIRPEGIKEALELQKQMYPLFFITERHENLRIETVKVLNDWGLKGPLYMSGCRKDISIELVSSAIKKRGGRAFRVLR